MARSVLSVLRVNAAPPPSPSSDVAIVARGPESPAPRPNSAAIRIGGAVGTGDGGFAANYFPQLDVWPLRWLGVGIEGEFAGMEGVSIFGPADTVSLRAFRGRAAVRWLFPSRRAMTALGAAVGVGPGQFARTHYTSIPCDSSAETCDDGLFGSGQYAGQTTEASALSVSIEGSVRVQLGAFELGGVLRYQTFGKYQYLTLGPTVGVTF